MITPKLQRYIVPSINFSGNKKNRTSGYTVRGICMTSYIIEHRVRLTSSSPDTSRRSSSQTAEPRGVVCAVLPPARELHAPRAGSSNKF
ncbi:hypothetical protein H9Q74_003647 [Fusarium xylarioides]|nr:hypothetical protein H9Q74_003647 [Fusarium xylarioides]